MTTPSPWSPPGATPEPRAVAAVADRPSPRGRRMPGAERRRQIATAARSLFARQGFAATTTREVATAAGVSDALIYRHFASKEAVLQVLVDAAIARFSELGPPPDVDPRTVPLEPLMMSLGRSFLVAIEEQLDLIVLMIGERHLLDGDTRFIAFIDGGAATLGAVIDHHRPPGVPAAPPERGYLLARAFMGGLVSLALLQWHLGLQAVHPVDPEDYLQVSVRTLLDGLGFRSGPATPTGEGEHEE